MSPMRPRSDKRQLIPGTTGWTAADLNSPVIGREWEARRLQIVEGVLALVPPAYWEECVALDRLVRRVQGYLVSRSITPSIACGVDLILSPERVVKGDAVYMSRADKARQLRAARSQPKVRGIKYGRLCVPPTLVIENVSRGYEVDDRVVKRRYYAEAGIPNYWILDVFARSLECLVLRRGVYALDQIGRGKASVTPKCFPGLVIDLSTVWKD